MFIKTCVVVLALLIPMPGAAAGIKQRFYSYSYDVAKSAEGDVFVVCVDCKDDSLNIVPEPLKLALRMSTEEPIAKLEQKKNGRNFRCQARNCPEWFDCDGSF